MFVPLVVLGIFRGSWSYAYIISCLVNLFSWNKLAFPLVSLSARNLHAFGHQLPVVGLDFRSFKTWRCLIVIWGLPFQNFLIWRLATMFGSPLQSITACFPVRVVRHRYLYWLLGLILFAFFEGCWLVQGEPVNLSILPKRWTCFDSLFLLHSILDGAHCTLKHWLCWLWQQLI